MGRSLRTVSQAAARIAAVVALSALVASGCGDSSAGDESSAETSAEASSTASGVVDEARPGGSVVYLTANEPPNLLPDSGGLGVAESFAIYDALAVLTADSEVEFRLAESIESDDDVVWTVTLRPDLVFSDGTPFDAAAIEYNWSRMADPANASPSAPLAQTVESMTVVDPTTLEVTLTEPNAHFARNVAQTALGFVASPTAWEAAGEGFASAPVGAGPYVLAGWDRGTQLRLTRNESYWTTTYLDEITIRYIADETQRLNTFATEAGSINISGNPPSAAAAEAAGAAVVTATLNGGWNLFFNMSAPPFDDIRARQAIAYAMDPTAWNDAVSGGAGELASTVFLEDSPFYADVPMTAPNREQAQALFDELAAEGTPLQFTVNATPRFQATVEWLQSHLASFENVSMEIEPVAAAQAIVENRNGDFTMGVTNQPRFTDPLPVFHDALQTGGGQNFSRFSNPAVDEALAAAAATTDEAERRDAYETVQAALVEDLPMHFFGRLSVYLMFDDDAINAIDGFDATINDGYLRWDQLWHE